MAPLHMKSAAATLTPKPLPQSVIVVQLAWLMQHSAVSTLPRHSVPEHNLSAGSVVRIFPRPQYMSSASATCVWKTAQKADTFHMAPTALGLDP
jgi:hypothetical protein